MIVQPLTKKKKKPIAWVVRRAETPLPAFAFSPSASSSLSSSFSSASSSELETGVDWVVPPIICEEEEEEKGMASNLRARFHERQRKRLFESIAINPIPSKKACPEPACLEPILVPLPVLAPSTIAVEIILEPDEKLSSADDIAKVNPFLHRKIYSSTKHGSVLSSYSADPDRDKQRS